MPPKRFAASESLTGLPSLVPQGRLSTADGDEFVQRRLGIFYGYVALLSTLATLSGYWALPGAEFRSMRSLQSVHAALLLCVYLALRRVWPPSVGRALDIIGTVGTAATAAAVLSCVPYVITAEATTVAFFVLFFVVRAALVPSTPLWASGIACVCLVPFTLGIAELHRRAGVAVIPNPEAATVASLQAMAAGVIGVHIVSHTVYGLRRAMLAARRLGQYVIHERIGGGAMGTIYRASHALLKRPTAIKVMSVDYASDLQIARFEREALATSRLTHPNTVAIYDFGRTPDGVFYYAMELLDGADLGQLVARDGRRLAEQSKRILRQVAPSLREVVASADRLISSANPGGGLEETDGSAVQRALQGSHGSANDDPRRPLRI